MSDAGAAVVGADEEARSITQGVHDGDAVAGHGALGVGGQVAGFGGGAVAAEVHQHDIVAVGELGSHEVPDVVTLREAVDEEERREGW